MHLSEKAISEFQNTHKVRFGIDIDYETAEAEGMKLIRFINMTQPRNGRYVNMDMNTKGSVITQPDSHVQKWALYGRLPK